MEDTWTQFRRRCEFFLLLVWANLDSCGCSFAAYTYYSSANYLVAVAQRENSLNIYHRKTGTPQCDNVQNVSNRSSFSLLGLVHGNVLLPHEQRRQTFICVVEDNEHPHRIGTVTRDDTRNSKTNWYRVLILTASVLVVFLWSITLSPQLVVEKHSQVW
jgi:hypothetical protein